MFLSRFFVRPEVRSTRRPQPRRRPLLEDLECRQLLSTVTATEFGSPPARPDIVGQHIGTNAVVEEHNIVEWREVYHP